MNDHLPFRRFSRTILSLLCVFALGSEALAQSCTPLGPKDVSGPLAVAHPGQSIAATFFEEGGCSWNGATQLNGTDGLVLDITGLEGTTGNVSGTYPPGRGLAGASLAGYFLDGTCNKIAESDVTIAISPEDAPDAATVTLPPTAKWFVVASAASGSAAGVTVNLHSDGYDCPVVKKKKRRRR